MRQTLKSIRKYWRIYLLAVAVVLSAVVLFSPVVPGLDAGTQSNNENGTSGSFVDQYTGLQFSIELGGGTRIRAPIHGVTAENVSVSDTTAQELEGQIAESFEGVQPTDVIARGFDDTERENLVEIASDTVTVPQFQEYLDNASVQYDSVSSGLSDETRSQAVSVLDSRINEAGLSGGSVRQVDVRSGETFILVEVPNLNREETIDLVTREGNVRIDVYFLNTETGEYENRTGVLTEDDFRSIGNPQQGDDVNPPNVPVTLEPQSANSFADDVVETGVAQVGGSACQFEEAPQETQPCLLTVVDGDVVYSAGMNGGLAADIRSGEWTENPSFILQTEDFSEAQDLSINLRSGSLPAALDVDSGEISFVAAEQGEEFRIIALLIGLFATGAVAVSVSLRYGEIRVAAPMVATAVSEVLILLAIATAISYPIDVAVIAGLIAVIGTGVDDLIIIADRVIGGERVAHSSRVFEKRFRKALWIIMSAAGTTILALGPLSVLGLRQLQGFAIFTIIGVIAGVLITRPAYGDILQYLYTDK